MNEQQRDLKFGDYVEFVVDGEKRVGVVIEAFTREHVGYTKSCSVDFFAIVDVVTGIPRNLPSGNVRYLAYDEYISAREEYNVDIYVNPLLARHVSACVDDRWINAIYYRPAVNGLGEIGHYVIPPCSGGKYSHQYIVHDEFCVKCVISDW